MPKQKPRVFVTQEVRNSKVVIDYAPAYQFGDVEFLTIMDYSSDKASIFNKVLIEELRMRLSSFDPDVDHIVVSGSPLVAAVVFMILRERTARVSFLRWSNYTKQYQAVDINLN